MKSRNNLLIALAVLIINFLISIFLIKLNNKKVAIVDAVLLVNEFNMKKELEASVGKQLEDLGYQLDNVNKQIKLAHAANDKIKIGTLTREFDSLSRATDEYYVATNQRINELVWKRLNPLVDEYAKEKGLNVIIAANGTGNVLYINEHCDMTSDLIKYINKKYENK